MSKVNSLAIITTQAPYSSASGKDALDMALIFGSYEQDIALFFIGDGVWQLIDKANGELLQVKDYLKTFSALPFYDVEDVFICEQSLKDRGIEGPLNIQSAQTLSKQTLIETLKQYKAVLRF
ncbi:sulfurtransferase complex subunit TusC [Thalassotalea sp. M1531]|uniref:Sulfurtransferase complex subunit TusC n=1 Tax=Thalassotalea algicola TaxID=2716224 RepID=A0A7Y0LD00_9GAMM|nr:sulfurtransferase complex subunit TusC [Thalassotalea algicola]NMP32323.1 sulfurtransferase complex subunit TusC [Thalassotalea algicola]